MTKNEIIHISLEDADGEPYYYECEVVKMNNVIGNESTYMHERTNCDYCLTFYNGYRFMRTKIESMIEGI